MTALPRGTRTTRPPRWGSAPTAAALATAACGGTSAKAGDCIDSNNQVVDCSSNSATQKLVNKQSGSTAIACGEIGDKPQTQVDGDKFCAEPK